MTLDDVNALTTEAFVSAFGDIAEHSPWVAEKAAQSRPFSDRVGMVSAFAAAIDAARRDAQLALIRAHPDLAGKAARAGKMAAASRDEQTGAGLDTLSEDEWVRFHALNEAYTAKFGFPFILAVKGATKSTILEAFAARIENDAATEWAMALTQIKRIVRFRVEDSISG